MKFNFSRLILISILIVFLTSCLGTTDVATYSANPCIKMLTFTANDSIPYLSTASFNLIESNPALKDSIIINLDSLPYKTRVDSVNPVFTFYSTGGAKLYFNPIGYKYHNKDSAILTGTDTVDFRQPVKIRNWSANGKVYKDYWINVNVHKVDPEFYNWSKLSEGISNVNATSQKAVILNDQIFYYQNDGSNSYLQTSMDGNSWYTKTPSGLPANIPLTDITQFNGSLYMTRDGYNIYSSTDGITWSKQSLSLFTFKSLLFVLNNQLWAVVQASDASYHFATSSDGTVWAMIDEIPSNFPISDFASVTYTSPTGKAESIVIGGFSPSGHVLINRWSTQDGKYWVDFSNENHNLDTLGIGASVITYDKKLFIFGYKTDDGTTLFKVSKDEGLTWQIPDVLRNFLPVGFQTRFYPSAVVLKPLIVKGAQAASMKEQINESNKIFVIGGKSGTTVFSDVLEGKLNRVNFLRQ